MNQSIIGFNIRKFRQNAGITIEQLAERTNLSDNFIGNIERGSDTPSLKSMIKIANALAASVDALLGENLVINTSLNNNTQEFYIREINDYLLKMTDKQKFYVLQCIQALENFKSK